MGYRSTYCLANHTAQRPYMKMPTQFIALSSKHSIIIAAAVCLALSHAIVMACSPPPSPRNPVVLTYEELRQPIVASAAREIHDNGKIIVYGDYLLINEPNKGFHIFDNSDTSALQGLAFVPVIGNLDITIKDDYLYADSHVDLVVFDLADMNTPKVVARLENVIEPRYPNRYYGVEDDAGVITELTY